VYCVGDGNRDQNHRQGVGNGIVRNTLPRHDAHGPAGRAQQHHNRAKQRGSAHESEIQEQHDDEEHHRLQHTCISVDVFGQVAADRRGAGHENVDVAVFVLRDQRPYRFIGGRRRSAVDEFRHDDRAAFVSADQCVDVGRHVPPAACTFM